MPASDSLNGAYPFKDRFGSLPSDWLSQCFSYLPIRSLTQIRRVSRHWKIAGSTATAVSSSFVRFYHTHNTPPTRDDWILVKPWSIWYFPLQVGRLDLRSVRKNQPWLESAFIIYTNLSELILPEILWQTEFVESLPGSLKHLTVGRVSKLFWKELSKYAPRLESLKILSHPRQITAKIDSWILGLHQLTHVTFSTWSANSLKQLEFLQQLPKLTQIHMDLWHGSPSSACLKELSDTLATFTTLREFSFRSYGYPSANLLPDDIRPTFGQQLSELENVASLKHLRHLSLLSPQDIDPLSEDEEAFIRFGLRLSQIPKLTLTISKPLKWSLLFPISDASVCLKSLDLRICSSSSTGSPSIWSPDVRLLNPELSTFHPSTVATALVTLPTYLTQLTSLTISFTRFKSHPRDNIFSQESIPTGFFHSILTKMSMLEYLKVDGKANQETLEDGISKLRQIPPHQHLKTFIFINEEYPHRSYWSKVSTVDWWKTFVQILPELTKLEWILLRNDMVNGAALPIGMGGNEMDCETTYQSGLKDVYPLQATATNLVIFPKLKDLTFYSDRAKLVGEFLQYIIRPHTTLEYLHVSYGETHDLLRLFGVKKITFPPMMTKGTDGQNTFTKEIIHVNMETATRPCAPLRYVAVRHFAKEPSIDRLDLSPGFQLVRKQFEAYDIPLYQHRAHRPRLKPAAPREHSCPSTCCHPFTSND